MNQRRSTATLIAALCAGLAALFATVALVSSPAQQTTVATTADRIELPKTGLFGGDVAVYAKARTTRTAPDCTLRSRSGHTLSSAKVRTGGTAPGTLEHGGATLRLIAVVDNPPARATLDCTGLADRHPLVAVSHGSPLARPAMLGGALLSLLAAIALPLAVLRGVNIGPRTSLLGR